MGNVDSARRLIERLRAAGTREFCVCSGSRNSPLLAVLGASDLPLTSFVDERSAAFFALGRIKLHGSPVAVVTTSGTAVAELLPAAVEAYYSGLPLVLVSADRPARYRRTGAPQSIDQQGIFGVFAETGLDRWTRRGPLHCNIEFDEPLIDGEPRALNDTGHPTGDDETPGVAEAAIPGTSPLVVVGGLGARWRERVRSFLLALGAPVYAEPLSGLREDPDLPLIASGERMIRRGRFDAVIRIGGVPALRYWRDLETLELPVVHFSDLPFPGLTRGDVHPIAALPRDCFPVERDAAFFEEDRANANALAEILDGEPESELAMIRALSREIAPDARLYLGNSLPIREWDLAAVRTERRWLVEANRGANGIDGQLSTFFGQCDPGRENVCVVGDLTAICDLGAPWVVRQLGRTRFRIVIVNNRGGRIFERVASLRVLEPSVRERLIDNSHDFHFGSWASMWGIDGSVTELRPDRDASARAWKRYEELWG